MDELEHIIGGDKSGESPARPTQAAPTAAPQSRVRSGWLIVAGILIIAVILGVQLAQQNRIQPQPGELAPLFTLTTFDGQTVSLEALRGKIVVVNFWANWCPPCHQEAADMVDVAEDYANQNVVFVGINWLEPSLNDALGFIERYEIPYQNGPDLGEKIAQAYRIEAAPETYVINSNGVIAETIIGPTTYEHLSGVLDGLIAAGGAS